VIAVAPGGAPAEPLLRAEGLVKHFPTGRRLFGGRRVVHAVNGVDFEIARGETFALVGESGCGKTTTARMVLGLESLTAGTLRFGGRTLAEHTAPERARLRRRVQVVFQDSNASLNPRKTLGQILGTALVVSGAMRAGDRRGVRRRTLELLTDVGLTPAETFVDRLPHELSGGQRQRVGIARALAPEPELVIADEPVSALDISVRAQILTLLARLKAERGVTLLLISHDLAVVRNVADRVGVMYLGRIIETGAVGDVFARPVHPYTAALVDATPLPDPSPAVRERDHVDLRGDVPSPVRLPSGCAFNPRCPIAIERCRHDVPALLPIAGRAGGAGGGAAAVAAAAEAALATAFPHAVACHRADERLAGLPLPLAPSPRRAASPQEPV
jgi:oligopeptide/dipeptide ABC transporter ATP-binding protein